MQMQTREAVRYKTRKFGGGSWKSYTAFFANLQKSVPWSPILEFLRKKQNNPLAALRTISISGWLLSFSSLITGYPFYVYFYNMFVWLLIAGFLAMF